jgi:glyceraldehyde-3-phosphate dehydrogenase (NADP+)
MAQEYHFYLAGQWQRSSDLLPVTTPWDDALVGSTWLASARDEAGLPVGALSVLPMSRQLGAHLVTDERFKLLTFTGSSSVESCGDVGGMV